MEEAQRRAVGTGWDKGLSTKCQDQSGIAHVRLDDLKRITAKAVVNQAVIDVVLPTLYALIDELIDANPTIAKQLLVKAKGALPRQYRNSFEKPKELQNG